MFSKLTLLMFLGHFWCRLWPIEQGLGHPVCVLSQILFWSQSWIGYHIFANILQIYCLLFQEEQESQVHTYSFAKIFYRLNNTVFITGRTNTRLLLNNFWCLGPGLCKVSWTHVVRSISKSYEFTQGPQGTKICSVHMSRLRDYAHSI